MVAFDQRVFSERLKLQRIKARYERQKDLAAAANVSAQVISYYEKGERLPDASILARLARALGCTADYLLGLEDAPTHDAADICKQTGLTPDAVRSLSIDSENCGERIFGQSYPVPHFLNSLLESEYFDMICALYAIWTRTIEDVETGDNTRLKKRFSFDTSLHTTLSKEQSIIAAVDTDRYMLVRALEDFLSDTEKLMRKRIEHFEHKSTNGGSNGKHNED